ncbi:SCO4983 family protein [Streptomyces sp. 8N114]|uniref:SCO4983 family protein n=1 Tax=Streptomyces sp. 8N114 TaxID=3457419 RepID=UPI003FD04AB1
MYEPIRTKSVHTVAESTQSGLPRRTREEELDIRLAGHLTALLTVTDELRALTPSASLDAAAAELAAHAGRLSGGRAPLRAAPSAVRDDAAHVASLHTRAHTLAGNALAVADTRGDEAVAALMTERIEAHAGAEGVLV